MNESICINVNQTAYSKNCLLKYLTLPFRHPTIYHRHQNMWQIPEITKIVGNFGYNVDVIDYDGLCTGLKTNYDLLIDIYPQYNQVYQNHLQPNCLKILFATGSFPDWQNKQEQQRLADLVSRRHVDLPPKAYVLPYPEQLQNFDALFLIGNETTLKTYAPLKTKQKSLITNAVYPQFELTLEHKSSRTFLFFSTYPQVLKGLDLLLEIFSKNPSLALIVCSQFKQEQDFCQVYYQELFESPNIIPAGPLDVTSDLFKKIAQVCSYIVLPSCTEGMSGSVLTGMAAGLIPIISPYCGIDIQNAYHFPDCSLHTMEQVIHSFANRPQSWIAREAARVQSIAQTQYSPKQFRDSFYTALNQLLTSGKEG